MENKTALPAVDVLDEIPHYSQRPNFEGFESDLDFESEPDENPHYTQKPNYSGYESDLDFDSFDFDLVTYKFISKSKSKSTDEVNGLGDVLNLYKAGAFDEGRKAREKALEKHLGIKPTVSEKDLKKELTLPPVVKPKKESVSKVKSRDPKNMSCMEFMTLHDTDEEDEEEDVKWITPKGIYNELEVSKEGSNDTSNSVEVSPDNSNSEMTRLIKDTVKTKKEDWKTETFIFNKICMPGTEKEKRHLVLWQKIDHNTFSNTLCFDFDGIILNSDLDNLAPKKGLRELEKKKYADTGLSRELELKKDINSVSNSVVAVMESSHGRTHILVKVRDNLINENNFKEVYGIIGEALNLKLNSKYDTACNDLERGFYCPNRIVYFNKNCADFDLKNFIKTNTACMLIGEAEKLAKNAVFDSVEAVSDPRVEVSLILLHEKNDTSTFDKDVDKNYDYKNERVEVSRDNSNSKRVEVSSDNSNQKSKKPKGEFVKGNRNNFLIKTISDANLNGDIDKLEEILYPYINHKNNDDKKYTKEVIDKKIDWGRKGFNRKFLKKSVFKETPKKSYEAYRELRINGKTHITAWTFTDSTISIATQKRWRAKYNKEFGIKAKYGVKGRKCKKQNLENK